MKILIREGSAARNFEALAPLLGIHPDKVMFCSDDRHPDDLVRRHINDIVRRALAKGYDPIDVIRACTLNPVRHYNLDAGLLRVGDPADFIIVDNLGDFNILETCIDGVPVARNGKTLIERVLELPVNNFTASHISSGDLAIPRTGDRIRVIEALEGQLITHQLTGSSTDSDGMVVSNVDEDILKITVINRYNPAPPALAFVKGFGLKKGAIASTVAHDSHNIIAVGTTDLELAKAINALVSTKGGICCVTGNEVLHLPLPFAGLMSDGDGFEVAMAYEQLNKRAGEMGCSLEAPFMTLSFMALLVIPSLKLSDKGLFDGNKFGFTSLFLDQI